jgi:uncharacterized DUF497 family protein
MTTYIPAKYRTTNWPTYNAALKSRGSLMLWIDKVEYDEIRMKGFAPLGNALYCVIYTDREGDERRVISLRGATAKEVRDYVSNY